VAVRWIHHERRLLCDAFPEIPPEVVVGALDIRGGAAVAPILVAGLNALLGELFRFLVAQRCLPGEVAGPFKRRELREIPRALQVGVTVRRPWNFRLRGLCVDRDGGDQKKPEENGTHTAAPFVVGRL